MLTKEMNKNWDLPVMPTFGDTDPTHGRLIGYWDGKQVVAGVFTTPPAREAEKLLKLHPGNHSAYQWLLTKVVVVHYLFTKRAYRSQGLARNLITQVTTLAVDQGCDHVIAVPTNPTAEHVFRKSNYLVLPYGVSLSVSSHHHRVLLGTLPAEPDVHYALATLGHTSHYTITPQH
ncbi:GNAT family N-acetyltransferase [Actinomyces faecalis]|uniref:GNAT family N-acetyltransferase n=1 Tax=Actinomyces faecalis TaxID=2722820 RepID=UPI002E28CC02|nr:GNAT family N-acetyltransferase [Actinomyces faecalis]